MTVKLKCSVRKLKSGKMIQQNFVFKFFSLRNGTREPRVGAREGGLGLSVGFSELGLSVIYCWGLGCGVRIRDEIG